jgi:uncharacterized coiled-coil DUF342 family protein
MENDSRIVELLTETLIKQDQMIAEMVGIKSEVKDMKSEVIGIKSEIKDMKSEIVKLSLQTSENTRAILKLANEVEKLSHLNDRVTKLQSVVYK